MSHVPADNLGSVISNAMLRKAIYTTYVVLVVIAGASAVAFAAIETSQPDWLVIATAVLAYLGIPVGGLAAINTPTEK